MTSDGSPNACRRWRALLAAIVTIVAPLACAQPLPATALGAVDLARQPQQWKLPASLQEASGLATSARGTLLIHGDEQAKVQEVDAVSGRVVARYRLGKPAVRDDFEGVAIDGTTLYVVTSGGRLYFAELPKVVGVASGDADDDAAELVFDMHDLGLANTCEIEGLDVVTASRLLAIACKGATGGNDADSDPANVGVHFYNLIERRDAGSIQIPVGSVAKAVGAKHFRPSGIVHDATRDQWLVVAAQPPAIAVLARDGTLIEAATLAADWHDQPEGVELLADGSICIVDEGRNGRARLSRYGVRE